MEEARDDLASARSRLLQVPLSINLTLRAIKVARRHLCESEFHGCKVGGADDAVRRPLAVSSLACGGFRTAFQRANSIT